MMFSSIDSNMIAYPFGALDLAHDNVLMGEISLFNL
jgi:hypothetical protein